MTDRKKFRDLATKTMTSSSRACSAARTREMIAAMPLRELRRARELSQAQLSWHPFRMGTSISASFTKWAQHHKNARRFAVRR